MSSPRHRGDGRGEAGDMLIQNMENGVGEEIGGTETNLKEPERRPAVRSSLVGPVSAAFGNKPECLRLSSTRRQVKGKVVSSKGFVRG